MFEVASVMTGMLNIHNTETDRALLSLVALGDTAAFSSLYDQYHQRVYNTAQRVLQSRVQAQDALQEVFIKIWVNREKLTELHSFPAWLNTVVRNLLYDKLRQQAHRERVLNTIEEELLRSYGEQTYTEAEFQELIALVEAAKSQLSPQQQRVFELSRLQGLKHREIAAEMNISVETVKKYIMDALKKVRQFLARHGKSVSVILLLQLI